MKVEAIGRNKIGSRRALEIGVALKPPVDITKVSKKGRVPNSWSIGCSGECWFAEDLQASSNEYKLPKFERLTLQDGDLIDVCITDVGSLVVFVNGIHIARVVMLPEIWRRSLVFAHYFTRAMCDVSWNRQKVDSWNKLPLAILSVYLVCLAVVHVACVHHCPCLGGSRDHRREPFWSTTSLQSLGRLVQCYGRKPRCPKP